MTNNREHSVYLKPYVDYRQKPKPREPFYQTFSAWLTSSKRVQHVNNR